MGYDTNPVATDKPELPEQPLSKPEVWVPPELSPEVLAWLKHEKSVRWSTPVVSNVYVIDRLSKQQICGTKGVDDWKHEADTRIRINRERMPGRTMTLDDLPYIEAALDE